MPDDNDLSVLELERLYDDIWAKDVPTEAELKEMIERLNEGEE